MITTYQANNILNYNFGGSSYTVPDELYIGLSTTEIGIDGTGVTEPTDASYARIKIRNDKTNFSVAADGHLYVKVEVAFQEALEPWGVVSDIFIADSLQGGRVLYFDSLKVKRFIDEYYEVSFPSGSIKIKMLSERVQDSKPIVDCFITDTRECY